MKKLCAIIFVSAFLLPVQLYSQEVDESALTIQTGEEDEESGEPSLSVFTAWDFVRMVLILGAVVGVIYVVFYFLKRSGNGRLQESGVIKVLSSKSLSSSRTLHLVEVGNQIFLIGTAENSVNLVSEILDKETLDGLRLQAASAESTERKNFGDVLSQVFGKQAGARSSSPDSMAFLRGQRQRIKNM